MPAGIHEGSGGIYLLKSCTPLHTAAPKICNQQPKTVIMPQMIKLENGTFACFSPFTKSHICLFFPVSFGSIQYPKHCSYHI